MSDSPFQRESFAADDQRVSAMTDFVLRQVDADAVRRVIEIGSGGGEQLISLARRLPAAHGVGLDISPLNTEAATQRAIDAGLSDRVSFETGDLMTWQPEPADLVYTYSVLYLVDGDDASVYGRVASLVATGGVLINAAPAKCGYNRLLHGVRATLRALRCRVTDSLIMSAAKLSADKSFDETFYRQRLVYMYTLPKRYVGCATQRLFGKQLGLSPVIDQPLPHTSVAQMKHRAFVYRKAASA